MSNHVVHFEIMGKDGGKLQEFYASLFGWEIDANNPMNYGLVQAGIGGGIGGGEEQNRVTIYIASDDMEATLEKAVALGGKVVHPITEIPGMVTFATFADVEGNVIGIVKNVPRT